ncbi:uncharacterized protein TRIADDRAFT_51504 [Trichoplax adhaerens]|uniref:FMP27/BLTP2/Hobbit GFWDK motif-containing RBG unit domain-containing protein n=1 Tax=Trichoplax adhaerens TaxID=10228 RepID=B3RJL0_TRIAD|nr:hypothetical protein TRIADDRAFT_51504 [Trichoplax adhaerens]EDV29316.1 hypothetical protein TRIADDRAFT_51504 [Trichoplax adhaerens]|eukprot:XP_002108518.1 hypothetical protein TRIADDRAFT_51504 [Trichoplax adhaerens]
MFAEYRQGSTKESTSTKNDVQTNTSTAISKKFVTLDLIAVNMKLSERTTTTWKATALKSIIVNTDNFTISSKTLYWNLDGNDIFSFETVCMTSTHEDQEMQSLRQTLPNLTNPTNKSWCWSVVNANAFFPFAYNFGVAFSDFTGIIKMLRILHKPSKKPGAIEKLPWDLLIKFENANFSCEDDPFEVKLGENYALLLDEADQCTQREELLEARLDKIRKTKGEFIPVKKIEELYRSLHEKNVQIYLQRSKKLHGSPLRRNLFSWKGEDLRIFAFADPSMHGKENIVSCMRRLDPNSPYPDSDPDYSTLWCRLIHIESKILNMPVRDYPQSIINIKGFKVDGMLAGAEVIPPDRDVEHLEIAYGPCFSPALAQVGLALDLLSKTSRDPSPRLTWWDKMRLLFHGRVSIFASALHYFWHASFDPYDKSERMEIRGKNADLDWFNELITRTVHLLLFVRIDLIWNCHGDCKDHHSVLPCAPDKIPAHQSDKAYDSYAAFRSRALKIKLALKFMEKAANDTVGKAMSSIPECYLYASSLRWLEHFKLVVLHHITRPVRRGKLYNNVRVRKPGFVQHIDVLDLDVSFPKLMLTYSGSFARKVGFRATSARGHLSIMFQHALIPYQDGLIRRPNSIWTTSESGYDINDVTIMLCANLNSDTEYLSPDFVDFDKEEHLLSLKSLTYRYNNKAIPPSKDDTNPYTHTIKINDLKASWTTFNRDTALSIFWANKKSQTLKHDLSSDFIKQIKHSTAKPVVITENVPEPESQRSFSANESKPFGNMLQDLLSDQSNFVVTCEDEKSDNTAQTTKNILPDEEDVHQRHILIEAVNSQVILKGTETNGCLVTSAANTRLYRLIHTPRWRSHKLLLKTSWSALFDNIQYFGTVGGSYYKTDDIPWLKPSLIQSRGTDSMDSIVSEGVGHVVHDVEKRRGAPRKSISFLRSTSLLDNDEDDLEITISDGDNLDAVTEEDEDQDQTKIAVPEIVQLQRIISRCSAQFSYISYMDEASNVLMESAQYAMLIDIVENFVLYVEPKKKEESELIEKMKFKLQLNEDEDIGTPLLQLQNTVRYQLRTMRKLERAMFLARQQLILHEEEKASRLTDQIKELEDEIIEVKENVDMACDELRLMITYTKRNMSNDCVEHKLEIGDFAVHNLLQVPNNSFKDALCPQKLKTKVQIDRDVAVRIFCREMPRVGGISVKEHFEVNVVPLAVRLTNHLYKNFMKFFFPHRFENSDASHDDETASRLGSDSDSDDDTMSIISESGGSSHFNFPSSPAASHKEFRYSRSQDTSSIKRCDSIDSVRSRASVSEGSHRRISFTHNSESNQDQKAERSKKLLRRMLDDEDVLNKMKERASKNQTFIYIKIPQVPLLVSYKGQKDKNLADVNDFNLALPTLEYHNVTWQWIDLLLAMKKDCRQALLSQAIKEKLRFRHTSDGESNPKDIDASKTSDQDKYRLLLGVQDKPSKKKLSLKLFGKKNAKEKDLKSPHSPLPTRANIPDSSIG